jgi:hypothetical protein
MTDEVVDTPADAPEPEVVQEAPEPQIDEAETKALRAVARQMGWKPEEDWKGDKSGWVDAGDFIANITTQNKSLKDQVQRATRTAEKIIEKERKASEREIERRIRELTEANDADGVIEATRELAKVRSDADPVDDWIAENPWFTDDVVANGIAKGAAEKAARAGKTTTEQLAAARAEVMKRMPELFDGEPATPAARPTPKAPLVQSGNRTASAPRKRGWSDIPQAARSAAAEMVRKGMCTEAEYADEYWKENA